MSTKQPTSGFFSFYVVTFGKILKTFKHSQLEFKSTTQNKVVNSEQAQHVVLGTFHLQPPRTQKSVFPNSQLQNLHIMKQIGLTGPGPFIQILLQQHLLFFLGTRLVGVDEPN